MLHAMSLSLISLTWRPQKANGVGERGHPQTWNCSLIHLRPQKMSLFRLLRILESDKQAQFASSTGPCGRKAGQKRGWRQSEPADREEGTSVAPGSAHQNAAFVPSARRPGFISDPEGSVSSFNRVQLYSSWSERVSTPHNQERHIYNNHNYIPSTGGIFTFWLPYTWRNFLKNPWNLN